MSLMEGNHPLVLRLAGDSADHTFWAPSRELPEWIFELTPGRLTEVSRLVRVAHLPVILDLNLVTAIRATVRIAHRVGRVLRVLLIDKGRRTPCAVLVNRSGQARMCEKHPL